MIPLRIRAKGFMSYREEQELNFDGAGLWVLAGRNGAGKSAWFDAITYALYERHRLGGKHKDLINQRADALLVEYEFAVGDDIYCVKRTLSRRGNPSRQVLHIKGPGTPVPSRPGPQAVPETDTQAGFEQWVRRVIGLSYETFTASVLLCQGKSDALLEAQPKDRHTMLSQIVDLSRYERLHELADEHRKEQDTEANACDRNLQAIEPVDEARLLDLAEQIRQANAAAQTAQSQVEHLVALKVHAVHWNKLNGQRSALMEELHASRGLFDHADQIERDAARLTELTAVVPRFRAYRDECARLETVQDQMGKLAGTAAVLQRRLGDEGKAREEKQRIRDELETTRLEYHRQRDDAQEVLDTLAPHAQPLRDIARLREQIAALDGYLAAFAPELDDRVERLRADVDSLTELATALPWLQQYADARTHWRNARAEAADAREKSASVARSIPTESVAEGIITGAAYAEHAQNELMRIRTLVRHEQDRLSRLDSLEGQPKCQYCGQELTPGHIEAERERVRGSLSDTQAQLGEAERAHKAAVKLKKIEDASGEALRAARQAVEHAEGQGALALQTIPGIYRARIGPTADAGVADCFARDYPTMDDLEQLRSRASQLDSRKQELAGAEAEARERDRLRAQREPAFHELDAIRADYPDERIDELRQRQQAASDRLKAAKRALSNLAQPLQEAESQLAEAEQVCATIEAELLGTETKQQQETARKDELVRIVAEKRGSIPAPWQAACHDLTADRIASWEAEAASLTGSDQRHDQLVQARAEESGRREHLQQIDRDQAAIPQEAHCPVETLEQQELAARTQADEVAAGLKAADDERRALETRRDQRAEWTKQYETAACKAHLYRELARLLGPDYLQRHLLQQAERGIVANANRVLDRISSGTLRLELRQDESGGGESATRAGVKALDLVAYNSDTGTSPLPVRALSGSQRFRASVSLALGIGYWAGQGAQRIESVIIDEGFGSLDRQGRRDMIDELHNLKSELKRIIVVSHQEEFAQQFTRGYYIKLVGGTSQVSDLDRHALGQEMPDALEVPDGDLVRTRVEADVVS